MVKPPRQLDDDQLIARIKEDARVVKAGEPVEENAPVDLEDSGQGLDVDGVERDR